MLSVRFLPFLLKHVGFGSDSLIASAAAIVTSIFPALLLVVIVGRLRRSQAVWIYPRKKCDLSLSCSPNKPSEKMRESKAHTNETDYR
jgi:hypothetical protein